MQVAVFKPWCRRRCRSPVRLGSCRRCRYRRLVEVAGLEVAGSGFKGEGAAAGAGRRSVFNNVAGAVNGEYLKSSVLKVAGNGIFKMSLSQSPAAAPTIRGMH